MTKQASGTDDEAILPGEFELEQKFNAAAAAVLAGLEQVLGAQPPGANGALFQALLNAEPL